jgi:DNA primase
MSENNTGRFVGFERLKQSLSMERVLERYGLLERLRRSGDSLSGVCPLHHGHNAAQFRVSLSKNCWICFGDCHTGGSIIDFVSRMERVGVREAGLLLQEWFNLKPGDGHEAASRKIIPHPSPKETPIPIPPSVNAPLHFTLSQLDGQHPYLKERGLVPETIVTFGVGCCAHGSLRGWIAIPIHDAQGRLLAYAGRWPGAPPDGSPKYRLPRGFRKSLELFNQHRAAASGRTDPIVVTEGFFGCMHVWQAGYPRVVSVMGSMLSKAQEQRIVELARESKQVLLLFDEDAAGRKGRAEAAERLGRSLTVDVVRLQEGQQPDSVQAEELLCRLGQNRANEEAAA